jgi:hypothetical protein
MKQHQIQLIERYQDDELSENELNEFLLLLEQDEEFRAEVSASLEMKGLLRLSQHHKTDKLEQAVVESLNTATSLIEDLVIKESTQTKVHRFPKWLIPAFVAQLILLPILFYSFGTASTSDTPAKLIAKIHALDGYCFIVRGTEKINPQVGNELYSGDHFHVQEKSKLQLRYLDGSKLKFFDNSFVRLTDLEGQKRVELFSGLVNGDVMPQKKKMIITTEHSSAEVLGTVFSISSSDVSSLLDVQEGKVRFNKGNESVLVTAKHYASTEQGESLQVLENDRPIYKSPRIDLNTPGHQIPITVDINGAITLYLVVSNAGDNNRFDHSAWLNPTLSGPKGSMSLCDLPWKLAKVGTYGAKINTGFYGGPLKVEGEIYNKGIAAHATSIIAWDIPEGYDQFEATGALLDSGAYRKDQPTVPSMHFEVYTSIPEKKLKTLLIRRHHY